MEEWWGEGQWVEVGCIWVGDLAYGGSLLCIELADPGMTAAAPSWALRFELPKEGGPIPGPAGWGMLGELGPMGGYTLFWLPGPWLRPPGRGWPGPWPCMGLVAFIPRLLVMPGPGPL